MESAVKRIGPTLSGRPLVEAGVRHAVGVNLHRIGNLDRARVQLERALEIRRERLGIDAGETLRTRVGRCQGLRSRPSAARWPLATFVRPPGGRQEGRSGANRRVEYLGAPGSDPWAPT
jgi:Arc/MetJ family transcription regulator